MPGARGRRTVPSMMISIGSAAPRLQADAFVRGEPRQRISLDEYLGTWLVVAFGARRFDTRELAELEEAFAADGAVVMVTTPHDWHDAASLYGDEPVRFPVLTGVDEHRRITMIVDQRGVVRHVGLRRTARETLASLELLRRAPGLRQAA
jgi:hypothetical protein